MLYHLLGKSTSSRNIHNSPCAKIYLDGIGPFECLFREYELLKLQKILQY